MVVSRHGVEHCQPDDDWYHEDDENWGLETRSLRGVGSEYDDDKLDGAEWHVEERGDVFVEAETAQDQGSKSIGYGGSDVEQQGHADPEIALWLEEDLNALVPFELS